MTVRYNYTWSRQENGTFDVDSWGRSANGLERDFSNAVSGSLLSTLSSNTLNEFRFQYAREDRPRPYDGPNIAGQTRPFPDTAFDFGSSYRFGEPFFLPVEYYDTRVQLTNNFSIIKGRHTIKVGGEFNRVTSVQTFIGFANGRYIFGSTDGFLNYVRQGPSYVECSNGTSNATGSCPAGTTITGPLLLFLQQAGVGSLSVEEAGTQDIPQLEPSLFIQDKWQPNSRLTVQYGVRWEAQIQPDPITPPGEVFYAGFIGRPGFPSDGTIPSDKKMFQPRLGLSWDPQGNGKQVVRFSSGLFYARIPGLNLASSRSTNGSRGQSLYRDSTFNGFGVTPPAWPNLIPQSAITSPDHPDVFVFDKDFRNPRTWSNTVAYERQVAPDLSAFVSFTHSDTDHITRFINRNDAVFGSPWSTGLGADGTQRHRRADRRREHGEVAVRRAHDRDEQEVLAGLSVPGELHAVARSLGRRQRARPVLVPLRAGRQPGARVQLLRSRPAPPVQRLAAHDLQELRVQQSRVGAVRAAAVGRQHAAGSHSAGRHDHQAEHAAQGQRVLQLGPARDPRLQGRRHRRAADFRSLQPDQRAQHPQAGGDEPGVQLRRHGAERPRRAAAGAVRRARAVLVRLNVRSAKSAKHQNGFLGLPAFSVCSS